MASASRIWRCFEAEEPSDGIGEADSASELSALALSDNGSFQMVAVYNEARTPSILMPRELGSNIDVSGSLGPAQSVSTTMTAESAASWASALAVLQRSRCFLPRTRFKKPAAC